MTPTDFREWTFFGIVVFTLFVAPVLFEWANRNAGRNRFAYWVEMVRQALAYE